MERSIDQAFAEIPREIARLSSAGNDQLVAPPVLAEYLPMFFSLL